MPRLIGEQNSQSKLTVHQVKSIRREYVPGVASLAEVGKRHGVSRVTVAQIINGRTWRHVPLDDNE